MFFLQHQKSKIRFGIIHFIGIGGIGMSGIAEIMYSLGYQIQGSDLQENSNTKRLANLGIKVFIGHAAAHVHGIKTVVLSSAINDENPELKEAVILRIPIISRAEMLAELIRFKTGIAISGSHGKTTTVSLTACMFEAAGVAPTVINGGIINNKSTNAYVGSSDYLIAEADESDATFIKLPATIAVITNIDVEHLDFYNNFENIIFAFKNFITNLPFYGFAVACADHPVVRDLINSINTRKIITYGIDSEDANVQAFNIVTDIKSSTFDVRINLPGTNGQITIEKITLPVPGKHNVLNSLAAISIAAELDFGLKVIKEGFKNFNGVKRRFSIAGKYNDITIIDDYAHHPSEIIETLKTAKYIADQQQGKLIVIFQPHRYSRLKSLFSEFATCFSLVDRLYISEIYSAGEQPITGISHHSLVEHISQKHAGLIVSTLDDPNEIPFIIKKYARPKDLVLMIGAGNINDWASVLSQQLEKLEN